MKLLKKSIGKNQEIIKAADKEIEKWTEKIKHGKYPKDGLYFFDRIAGFICQRFWCYGKTKDYSDKLKINHNCTGGGLCVRLCPMENLVIKNNKAAAKSRCTMCYRSVLQRANYHAPLDEPYRRIPRNCVGCGGDGQRKNHQSKGCLTLHSSRTDL